MAKKRHYESARVVERPNYGRDNVMKRDEGGYQEVSNERNPMKKRAMMPNDPRASIMKEDWSAPALCPRGVHEMQLDAPVKGHRSGRLGDLYAEVERTTREDQQIFDKLTDPTNW